MEGDKGKWRKRESKKAVSKQQVKKRQRGSGRERWKVAVLLNLQVELLGFVNKTASKCLHRHETCASR